MTRVLLWKEFREQRPVVLSAWALAVIIPAFLMLGMQFAGARGSNSLAGVASYAVVMVLWPLFALATGAMTVAGELNDGSLRFLLSRPVSRPQVWFIKVGTAVIALVLIGLGTFALSAAFDYVIADGRGLSLPNWREVVAIIGLMAWLMVCAHYCSMFFRNPLAAALAGGVVAGGVGAVLMSSWNLLALSIGRVNVNASAWTIPIATVALLVAAYRFFRRGDLAALGGARRMAWPLVAVTLFVILVAAVPVSFASMRDRAIDATRRVGDLRVVDDSLVLPRTSSVGLGTQLTRYSLSGEPAEVIVGGSPTLPARTSDGAWVVYLGSDASTVADRTLEIRAVRIDGSEDHAISTVSIRQEMAWRALKMVVSPDDDHVALVSFAHIDVASISGASAPRRIDLQPLNRYYYAGNEAAFIGWSAEESPRLLLYRIEERSEERRAGDATDEAWAAGLRVTRVYALDPASGEESLVAEFDGAQHLDLLSTGIYVGARAPQPWSHLPLLQSINSERHLYLVDLASGSMRELSISPCRAWGFSGDNTAFIYGHCDRLNPSAPARVELRRLDLRTGEDTLFADLPLFGFSSRSRELILSPDGSRLLAYGRAGYRTEWATFVIPQGGAPAFLYAGLLPIAWRGNDEAVLFGGALGNADPTELRVVGVDRRSERELIR